MKRPILLTALLVFLSACSPAPAATVRIGYLGPLSGKAAAYGIDTLNGIRMAVDQVNLAGGIDGKKIELIAEDGHCSGPDAASAVDKLITIDHVVAIIGGICNPETIAAAPLAEAAKIVLLSPLSSDASITTAGRYIFRMTPSDALKGKAIGGYIKSAGLKKVAMITENTSFPQILRESVTLHAPEGVEIVFDEVTSADTKNFRALFQKLQKVDFDVFIANGQTDTTIAEMAKQLRAHGMKQQIVGADAANSATLGEFAPDAVEGMQVLTLPDLDESIPAAKDFAEAFRRRFETPRQSLYFAALGFDTAHIMFDGLRGGAPTEANDHLLTMDVYLGLTGKFHFDENGDIVGAPLALKTFESGSLSLPKLLPYPE